MYGSNCEPALNEDYNKTGKNSETFVINSNDLLSVFFDCSRCDMHHIRQSIRYINIARDKEDADVHLIITTHSSGVSGYSYVISLIGNKEFKGINNEIKYWVPGSQSWDETREGLAERLKLGLAPYIANTDMADRLSVRYNNDMPFEREEFEDPWKNWVFEIYGGANYRQEETQNSFSARYGFYADKISEEYKIRVRPFFNYNERNYITDEDTVTSVSNRDGFDGHVIKSIDDNWSAGIFTDMLSSTFNNLHFNADISTGVEYSLFPYEEATRRSITFAYKIGYSYNNYIETTIFDKDIESLVVHGLEASVRFQQTWGSVRAGLSGSHYFHDFNANRAEFYTRINLRLFKGFSLSLRGDFDLINDLVSIPQSELSLEEILLEQRRQATNYQVSGSIGLSYTFGSDFANIVNTRF